jgi:N-acetyl-gamma-glutamyl-phosphate reductase
MTVLKAAILGASGYTGAELVRLLSQHPNVEIVALTADRQAGKTLGAVFPHLAHLGMPVLTRIEDQEWRDIDFVFVALPHGTTQEVIAALPEHLRIVDLSADFRLRDGGTYAQWYGHAHKAPHLQGEAVYGLTEHNRAAIKTARLVANPGCYPTCALLPLLPLLKAKAIAADHIIVDAKSGVSGAGRDTKLGSLYSEVTEGTHAYGIAGHRHAPEIEQELSAAAGSEIKVTFTPHLMPMSRGMLATIYVQLETGFSAARLRKILSETYADESFVKLLEEGISPATRNVRGANYCHINVFEDRIAGRAILISAIDNLVKGASGQAVQNMNLMLGFDEALGLTQQALFP